MERFKDSSKIVPLWMHIGWRAALRAGMWISARTVLFLGSAWIGNLKLCACCLPSCLEPGGSMLSFVRLCLDACAVGVDHGTAKIPCDTAAAPGTT